MNIGDHAGLFFALLLAALMAREILRYYLGRSRSGLLAYPLRRLLRRAAAFALLELALAAAIVPQAVGLPLLAQLVFLCAGLVLALLSLLPIIRDWREIRSDLLRESDELTQQAANQLIRAVDQELRKTQPPNQEHGKE